LELVVSGRTRQLVSRVRFLTLAGGTVLLALSAWNALTYWSPLWAAWFNLCAYLGLRIAAVRSALRGTAIDDHLSWSGAMAGALVGLTPLVLTSTTVLARECTAAMQLLCLYYVVGRSTCLTMGCCEARSPRVRLPAMELVAVAVILLVSLALPARITLAFLLCAVGVVRVLSRIAREGLSRGLALSVSRIDALATLVAGIVLFLRP
jgi:hypothetical protein